MTCDGGGQVVVRRPLKRAAVHKLSTAPWLIILSSTLCPRYRVRYTTLVKGELCLGISSCCWSGPVRLCKHSSCPWRVVLMDHRITGPNDALQQSRFARH